MRLIREPLHMQRTSNLFVMIFLRINLHCKLQRVTKVVETLSKNDACRCLCTNFILFVTSVNSFIPRPPNSMFCRRRDLWSVSTLLSLIVVSVQYWEYDLIKVTRSNANIPTPAPNAILVHRRLPLSILLCFPKCSVYEITFQFLSGELRRETTTVVPTSNHWLNRAKKLVSTRVKVLQLI